MLGITKQLPIVGIQFDYDVSGGDKLIPDQVFPGQLLVDNDYSFSAGPLGLVAFSFALLEILPEENPVGGFSFLKCATAAFLIV